ncbi:MAG: DUF1214 domain-containing protein [Candidatus Lokiarchaeota archaeon]|nr:DUF1214 domain-containing protein [Candidatus Lokiarchaeota archaeon]
MILIILIISSLIVAVCLAYFWYWYQLRRATVGNYDIIRNGCWQTNRRGEGSREALRVHRARIAKIAGFGMNRDEAIYWHAEVDSHGNKIKYNYKYRVEGQDPATRWWCLSVNLDGFFVPNLHNRYSFSKTDVKRETDGSWEIKLSTEEQSGNWIPLGDQSGYYRIILRCYNPNPSMIENSESANLPQIILED